jgi:CoA:oxalate CoA-transferase
MSDTQSADHLDPNKPYPLAGITVLDFCRVLSGPTCARMLADAGARVIKIERPSVGDDTRQMGPFLPDGTSEYFRFANLGKESVAVDLKDPEGLALVRRMIAKADIVIENFRPGVMAKLGLAPNDLLKEHPRLIVCSISGFGQYGPMHQQAAYDTIIQALSGIMDATGWPDGPATRVGTSIADIVAGVYGYCAIVTALAARELTGEGTTVDVAMLDSTLALLEHGLMDALGLRERPQRLGNRHPFIYPFDTFNCQDQPLAVAVGNDHLFGVLMSTLGKADLAHDDRFDTNEKRSKNWEALKNEMEIVLKTETAAAWRERLEQAGIPVGVVLNVADTRELPQIKARGMVKRVGGYEVPGSPMKYGAFNSLGTEIPSPALDAQGDAIRAEFAAEG